MTPYRVAAEQADSIHRIPFPEVKTLSRVRCWIGGHWWVYPGDLYHNDDGYTLLKGADLRRFDLFLWPGGGSRYHDLICVRCGMVSNVQETTYACGCVICGAYSYRDPCDSLPHRRLERLMQGWRSLRTIGSMSQYYYGIEDET